MVGQVTLYNMNETFYYPSIGEVRFPHECYMTEEQAYDVAIDMLKMKHGYDLYAIYEDDIKVHKIILHG